MVAFVRRFCIRQVFQRAVAVVVASDGRALVEQQQEEHQHFSVCKQQFSIFIKIFRHLF